jgi:acetyl-CoA acetyltransferase
LARRLRLAAFGSLAFGLLAEELCAPFTDDPEVLAQAVLYAQVLAALVARTGIDPALVEDVITGCVIQVAEQAGNIGRQAVLAAGFPETVPAVTLDRKCGSAQQAIDFAAQGVIAGAYDMVIAGGVEMMGKVPMRINRMGKDDKGPRFHARYPQGLVHQGISAELINARWQVSREAQDEYALRSHLRAAADIAGTARDIVSIELEAGGTRVSAESRSSERARCEPRLSRASAWISSTMTVSTPRSSSRVPRAVRHR